MNTDFILIKQDLTKNDCEQIEELKEICSINGLFLKLELDYKLMTQNPENNSFEEMNSFFYYSDNKLVGYLDILYFGGNTAEVTGMVHPSYRNEGIFTKLYKLAKAECERRKLSKLLLISDTKSESGIAFIRSVGGIYFNSECEMEYFPIDLPLENREVTLQKARNADAKELLRMDSIFFGDDEEEQVPLPEEEETQGIITYFVLRNNIRIGKIRIIISNQEGYLCGFGILPEYRRKGFGKQAVFETLALLKKSDVKRIIIEADTKNLAAVNLYKACGFQVTAISDYYEVLLES